MLRVINIRTLQKVSEVVNVTPFHSNDYILEGPQLVTMVTRKKKETHGPVLSLSLSLGHGMSFDKKVVHPTSEI